MYYSFPSFVCLLLLGDAPSLSTSFVFVRVSNRRRSRSTASLFRQTECHDEDTIIRTVSTRFHQQQRVSTRATRSETTTIQRKRFGSLCLFAKKPDESNKSQGESSNGGKGWFANRRRRFLRRLDNQQPEDNLTDAAQEDDDADYDDDEDEDDEQPDIFRNMTPLRRARLEQEHDREERFLVGDDLHYLRQQVLELRMELQTIMEQEADDRRNKRGKRVRASKLQKQRELEQAILQAQQMDAEFIYQMATERAIAAEQAGWHHEAQKYRQEASHARKALPQFNLEGLWVGKYRRDDEDYEMLSFDPDSEDLKSLVGFEIVNCTYHGDTLIATKVTGHGNVPKGEISFQVDLSPFSQQHALESDPTLLDRSFPNALDTTSLNNQHFGDDEEEDTTNDTNLSPQNHQQEPPMVLEPIELNQEAAEQWGSRFLYRFPGMGQVASTGFRNAQWMDGQLILVGSSYFSFAWLPIGQQVFFGRPSAEMTLKLLRQDQQQHEQIQIQQQQHEQEGLWMGDILNNGHGDNRTTMPSKTHKSAKQRQYLNQCWYETELLQDDLDVSDGFTSHEQQDYYGREGCFE